MSLSDSVGTLSGVGFSVEETEICAATDTVVSVDERDFSATYVPVANHWAAVWKWSEGKEQRVLRNRVEAY